MGHQREVCVNNKNEYFIRKFCHVANLENRVSCHLNHSMFFLNHYFEVKVISKSLLKEMKKINNPCEWFVGSCDLHLERSKEQSFAIMTTWKNLRAKTVFILFFSEDELITRTKMRIINFKEKILHGLTVEEVEKWIPVPMEFGTYTDKEFVQKNVAVMPSSRVCLQMRRHPWNISRKNTNHHYIENHFASTCFGGILSKQKDIANLVCVGIIYILHV